MSSYDDDHEDEVPPGSSVFGDDTSFSSGSSVFDTPGEEAHEQPGPPGQQSVFGDEPASPSLDDDPWGDAGSEDAIPLDVDAPESDDLDAWSVLGSSSPRWTEGAADAEPEPTWDPGPAPAGDEPETVKIGEPSERFFTYDDQGAGHAEEAFVATAGAGRDMQAAVITGVVLLAVALIALSISPVVALVV